MDIVICDGREVKRGKMRNVDCVSDHCAVFEILVVENVLTKGRKKSEGRLGDELLRHIGVWILVAKNHLQRGKTTEEVRKGFDLVVDQIDVLEIQKMGHVDRQRNYLISTNIQTNQTPQFPNLNR